MIKADKKAQCCGCRACGLVCPPSCISFAEDSLGAAYPSVDRARCVGCGKCEAVCPMQRPFGGDIGKTAYAAFSNDRGVRFRGSSGGLFETFGALIIAHGGSVFASKFDAALKLKGFEATTAAQVRELTKSKYLQSDSIGLFPVIRQRILEGREVLFCGTPCQTAALKQYLGEAGERKNVYLIDFFCHGVPSQRLFEKCIRYVEKKENIRITSFEFRTKKPGGATSYYFTETYEKNGAEHQRTQLYFKDPFFLGFQKYLTLRDSCYQCPYGKGNHSGDITIGDFHEIDRYVKGINRFDGVSTVIINTEKGEKLWSLIKDQLSVYEMDIHRLHEDGMIFSGSVQEPKTREEFIRDMETKPFDAVADRWFNAKKEWKKGIYYALPAPVRRLIKRVAGI